MEERNIKVNLDKARDWYNSGNSILKALALQAFTKEELERITIERIINSLLSDCYRRQYLNNIQIAQLEAIRKRKDMNNISAPKLLRILAVYFNEKWKKEIGNTGYFISKREWSGHQCYNRLGEDWCIVKHESVNYPIIPYFKDEKCCKEAFNILKYLNKLDNLYTDF